MPDERGTDVPETISHYAIGARLGAGGMGAVYTATDRRDGSAVAIKILSPQLSEDESFRERFEREAHVGALLRSPYVARLLDHGFENGRFFIVMEYIEGQTLRQAINSGPIEPTRALKIIAQSARALEEAEARGVIHRDIKPDNILLSTSGTAKVADFGIAKQLTSGDLTITGSFVGTLSYAAPERAIGRADRRSDIYSLGATLFHALSGQPPFRGDAFELLRQHADAPVPLDKLENVPDNVRAIVARCMEKDPDTRYQSATELAGDLEAAASALKATGEDTPTEIIPPPEPVPVPQSEPTAEPTPAPEPVASDDTPTEISPPRGTPEPPPAPTPEPSPAPAPQPKPVDGGGGSGGVKPPTPPVSPRKKPSWLPLAAGAGVVAAIAVGAFVLLGGGGDDDDDNGGFDFPTNTFSFDTSTDGSFETLPPFGSGSGLTADDPIPAGSTGVIADRMAVTVSDGFYSSGSDGTTQALLTLDVENVGSDQLDVFFEPFYYMIGSNAVEYDEFDDGCPETNRIEGILDPGDSTFGEVCIAPDGLDTNVVFYIELNDEIVYFELP